MPDPTTIAELQSALATASVSPRFYSFHSDGWGECYRLQEFHDELGQGWHYYYAERGLQTGLVTFRIESEACGYFFQKVLPDPTTRLPGGRIP